jgi:hypothetical protein
MSSYVQSVHASAATALWLALLLFPVSILAAERALDAAPNPMGGGGAAVLERVPEKPSVASTQRIVFTCVTPELTTFSDRPCGPLPERREIELLPATGTRGGEAASVAAPAARASTRPAAVRREHDAQPSRRAADRERSCQPLRHAVASIDQQMRAGYSAREAPRLWERWRAAKDRLHSAGCS